jgi:hypothetical protein
VRLPWNAATTSSGGIICKETTLSATVSCVFPESDELHDGFSTDLPVEVVDDDSLCPAHHRREVVQLLARVDLTEERHLLALLAQKPSSFQKQRLDPLDRYISTTPLSVNTSWIPRKAFPRNATANARVRVLAYKSIAGP